MVALVILPKAAMAASVDCRQYLNIASSKVARRAIMAADLVRLRDIGSNGGIDAGTPALTISPDHRSLAFQIRRADPDANKYCVGMFILPLNPGAQPRLIDVGDEAIRLHYNFRGKAGFPTGVMATIKPLWTPDGRAVLFLKRSGNKTQIWRAEVDGSGSRPLTRSRDDIVDFWFEHDGRALAFRTQPGLRLGERKIEQEGRRGYHYDGRFSPMTDSRPFVPAPVSEQTFTLPLPAFGAVPQIVTPQRPDDRKETEKAVTGSHGEKAWLHSSGGRFPPPRKLYVRLPNGAQIVCSAPLCDRHVSGLWWTADGRLRFFRREGWGNEATAVYEWLPGQGKPKRLFVTRDLLTSCVPIDDDIICLREAATRPRYISRISLLSKRETVLFEPIERIASRPRGRSERGKIVKFAEAGAKPKAGLFGIGIFERLEEIGSQRRVEANDGVFVGAIRRMDDDRMTAHIVLLHREMRTKSGPALRRGRCRSVRPAGSR
jgi:hypothetical protein